MHFSPNSFWPLTSQDNAFPVMSSDGLCPAAKRTRRMSSPLNGSVAPSIIEGAVPACACAKVDLEKAKAAVAASPMLKSPILPRFSALYVGFWKVIAATWPFKLTSRETTILKRLPSSIAKSRFILPV